jgi:hypothetical protein
MRRPSSRWLAVDAARSQATGPEQVSSKSCQTQPLHGDAGVAVQRLRGVRVEFGGQPGVRRGHGGRGYGSTSAARVPRAALTVVTVAATTTSVR